jgi:hypothetical protein
MLLKRRRRIGKSSPILLLSLNSFCAALTQFLDWRDL